MLIRKILCAFIVFVQAGVVAPTLVAQATTVYGKVVSEQGPGLVGVGIRCKQIGQSTVSGVGGTFKIELPGSSPVVLQFSMLGYHNKTISLQADTLTAPILVVLKTQAQNINEVQVKADRKEIFKSQYSLPVVIMQEEYFQGLQSIGVMEALSKLPGVQVMDISGGISKPMIRGLGFYRVSVAQNGVKHEGQQWSKHHGVSIANHGFEHIEIVKGPAVLRYGSGAVGGVINILPPHVPLEEGVEGKVNTSLNSNPKGIGVNAEILFRKKALFGQFSVGYAMSGDTKIPVSGSFLLPAPVSAQEASHKVGLGDFLPNTAGKHLSLNLVAGVVKKWGKSYLQFNCQQSGIGFFDWQGLQNDSITQEHQSSKFDFRLPWQQTTNWALSHVSRVYHKRNVVEVTLGIQEELTREYAYLDDRTGRRHEELKYFKSQDNLDLLLKLNTINVKLGYKLAENGGGKFEFGASSNIQWHTKGGFNHILPAYQKNTFAGFVLHTKELSHRTKLISGIRLEHVQLNIEQSLNPDVLFGDSLLNPGLKKTYPMPSASVGLATKISEEFSLKLNAGYGYRYPSVYELAAYGLHRHEIRFEKGSSNLMPEKSVQLDLEAGYTQGPWRVQLSPFASYFFNYLFLQPTAELRPEGQVYANEESTTFHAGAELQAACMINRWLSTTLSAEYVYAVNLERNSALPYTPPLQVLAGAMCKLPKMAIFSNSKLGAEGAATGAQNYTAINELSTPGSLLINLIADTEIPLNKVTLRMYIRAENVFSTRYYNHLSLYRRLRIPEPGRSLQFAINVEF